MEESKRGEEQVGGGEAEEEEARLIRSEGKRLVEMKGGRVSVLLPPPLSGVAPDTKSCSVTS